MTLTVRRLADEARLDRSRLVSVAGVTGNFALRGLFQDRLEQWLFPLDLRPFDLITDLLNVRQTPLNISQDINDINGPFEAISDVSQAEVDRELWTYFEGFFANGTHRLPSGVPEALDALQAEVVSTWDGGGVVEEIQTDAAVKLLL